MKVTVYKDPENAFNCDFIVLCLRKNILKTKKNPNLFLKLSPMTNVNKHVNWEIEKKLNYQLILLLVE